MGTSGAVKHLAHLLDGTFLVLNGDVLIDVDFQRLVALHRERQAATLALVGCPTRARSAWSRWTPTTASPPSWKPAPTRTPG